jgi:hypothetical protein
VTQTQGFAGEPEIMPLSTEILLLSTEITLEFDEN